MADSIAHDQLLAKLEAQRTTYLERLPARVQEMQILWGQMIAHESLDALGSLALEAHRLAGSGATFGFEAVSESARIVATLLQTLQDRHRLPNPEQTRQVGAYLDVLADQVQNVVHAPSRFISFGTAAAGDGGPAAAPPPLLYVLEADQEMAQIYATLFEAREYVVRSFSSIDAILEASRDVAPSLVIFEPALEGDALGGMEVVELLRAEVQAELPMLCVTARADFQVRLAAVRAGADFFFTKPFPARRLHRLVDDLTGRGGHRPYSVLLVDDDELIAECHATVLSDAGIETYYVADPRNALSALQRVQPEVILMDLYMPGCNGIELSAVIRQFDQWAHVPIVFLSTETDEERQYTAKLIGGDDFLTKPVAPKLLIKTVRTRAQRARLLNDQYLDVDEARKRAQAANASKIEVLAKMIATQQGAAGE